MQAFEWCQMTYKNVLLHGVLKVNVWVPALTWSGCEKWGRLNKIRL